MPKSYKIPNKLPDSVFRAYDIRGCADTKITADLVYAMGLAFGTEAQVQEQPRVVVGRDGRLSSPHLHKALCAGLIESGVHVDDRACANASSLFCDGTSRDSVGDYAYGESQSKTRQWLENGFGW